MKPNRKISFILTIFVALVAIFIKTSVEKKILAKLDENSPYSQFSSIPKFCSIYSYTNGNSKCYRSRRSIFSTRLLEYRCQEPFYPIDENGNISFIDEYRCHDINMIAYLFGEKH